MKQDQIGDEFMEYPLIRECIANGVYFSSITDKKFKHNRISVNLIVKLDREKVTDRAVVPFILRQGSKNCPDFTDLNKKLCDLYGASLDAGVDKIGEYQMITLGIIGVDNRFALSGEDMVQECTRMLCEIVLEPDITDGKFNAKNTELEKQYLLETISSEINDKRTYANIRCKDIMCKDEACAIKKYGYAEDAQKITPESAAKAYQELIETAQVEIMFEGCGDPNAAKEIFRKKFAEITRNPISIAKCNTRPQQGEVKQVVEKMDVKQGKLVMGFRVENMDSYTKMNAERVAIGLFGGTASSFLFKNVREKMSLCYYCSSQYDRHTGIMMVYSGVEAVNAQKAKEAIIAQLEMMQRGDFSEKDLEETKLFFKTALKATGDSLGAMDSWYLAQIMGGTEVSPDMEIELCSKVTKQDVIDAVNCVKLDTVYMLMPQDEKEGE